MNDDQLRQLVTEHVRRALQADGPPAPAPPVTDGPAVIALFCGGRGGLSTALAQTKTLAQQAPVVGVLTPAAKETIGEERLRKEGGISEVIGPDSGVSLWGLVDRTEPLLVAQLTRTTLAKVALGLGDSLAAALALNTLWAGKPVVVARDGVDPDLAARDPERVGDAPLELVRLYAGYLARLEALGCDVIPAERIADTVLALRSGRETRTERPLASRRVITEEDIRRAARRGEAISITGAIVTPLARDVAADLDVELLED